MHQGFLEFGPITRVKWFFEIDELLQLLVVMQFFYDASECK